MRQDLVVAAATNPGHALSFKYDEKLNGAEELCRRQGIAFFPLAAETLGGWHRVGEREIKKLGSALATGISICPFSVFFGTTKN